MINRYTILTLLLICWTLLLQGQENIKSAYRIEGSNIVLLLDNTWSRVDQEKLLEQSGMKGLSLDTLWQFGNLGRWAKEGWKLSQTGSSYKIYKSISTLSGNLKYKDVTVSNDILDNVRIQTTATFGFNSFKKQSVIPNKNGTTQFILFGKLNAHDVYLSGTFNNWSTLNTPMIKTDSGWVANVALKPGKHCYKFIVNGHWMADPENTQREDDLHSGYNSVYFVTNYEFVLKGYENANQVTIAATFNNWNENRLRLKRSNGVWRLPVYLNDGTYAYKFIVDKNWITDPANPNTRDDGQGNKNPYLQLGALSTFRLDGFTKAQKVIVAGNFNNWNEHEIKMTRTSTGWEISHALAAGNYQYKFIVDGEWMLDPKNPHSGSFGGYTNSVWVAKANQKFTLKGFPTAKEVSLAGNFNEWTGYSMRNIDGVWSMDVFLPPGKCLYKFIVDGIWIIDPVNELWEQNEFGNGNSVLWVAPQ